MAQNRLGKSMDLEVDTDLLILLVVLNHVHNFFQVGHLPEWIIVDYDGIGQFSRLDGAGISPRLTTETNTCLAFLSLSEVMGLKLCQVSKFDGQHAIQDFTAAIVPVFVIDQIEVAERTMDQVETDVGGDCPQTAVVLNKSVQKHGRIETIMESQLEEVDIESFLR